MSGTYTDLSGRRFGKLIVIKKIESYISPKGKKYAKWQCLCDCGNSVEAFAVHLKQGRTISCGCARKTHDMTNTRVYNIWRGIKGRCNNQNSTSYKNYGKRNITICEEWKNSFEQFYEWAINHGYKENLSIDRINNEGNYEPSNCRWVSSKMQSNNRRTNKHLSYCGEKHTITEWSELLGGEKSLIRGRLKMGWSLEKALSTPVRKYRKNNEIFSCVKEE